MCLWIRLTPGPKKSSNGPDMTEMEKIKKMLMAPIHAIVVSVSSAS